MNDQDKRCEECSEPLRPSQYARVKREGEPAAKDKDALICRNYHACSKAEKEIQD